MENKLNKAFMTDPEFEFDVDDTVVIAMSGEQGRVIGRSEHLDTANQYHIRYKGADGMARETWWTETALCTPEQYADLLAFEKI